MHSKQVLRDTYANRWNAGTYDTYVRLAFAVDEHVGRQTSVSSYAQRTPTYLPLSNMIYARLLIYSSIQATVLERETRYVSPLVPQDETNQDNLATFYCVDLSEPPADHLSLQLAARTPRIAQKEGGCPRYEKALLFTSFFFFLFPFPFSGCLGEECRHVSRYFSIGVESITACNLFRLVTEIFENCFTLETR